ncbi:MAG TPA: hypothetical protein VEH27_06745 [Methylomirabilota bacterium]|nr:hypothetical protein [Methylomirabilota bacterium]
MPSSEEQKKFATQEAARWAAVERVKAQELAALTEERAREIIFSLVAIDPWRDNPNWSGLVEQQALFHKSRK